MQWKTTVPQNTYPVCAKHCQYTVPVGLHLLQLHVGVPPWAGISLVPAPFTMRKGSGQIRYARLCGPHCTVQAKEIAAWGILASK